MSEHKIPSFVPVIAETGGNYPAGANPWNGTPREQEASAGQYAAGVEPGPGSWFGAQSFNALGGRLGRAINAMLDRPTFEVTARLASVSDAYSYNGNAVGNTNTSTGGDPPLLLAGPDYNGGNHGTIFAIRKQVLAYHRQGQGLSYANASDTDEWFYTASAGLGAGGGDSGETVGGVVRCPVQCVSRTSGYIATFAKSGDMRASADFGATWSSTHNIDAGLATAMGGGAAAATCAAFFGTQVFTCYSVGGGPYLSDLWTADQSDFTTWEHIGNFASNSGASNIAGRMVTNGTVALFLPRVGTIVNRLTGSPGSWTLTKVQFATHSTAKTHWRGAWSEALGLFMIGNPQGDVWISPDGSAWTQIFTADPTIVVRDIVAHGRGFVISNSASEWALDFISLDSNQTWSKRRIYTPYQGNSGPASAWHLQTVAGRWVAARVTQGSDSVWRLEWCHSGVDPWQRNNYVGV